MQEVRKFAKFVFHISQVEIKQRDLFEVFVHPVLLHCDQLLLEFVHFFCQKLQGCLLVFKMYLKFCVVLGCYLRDFE